MSKGISHQNKDILFKILAENFKNKSLKIYGLDLPPIKTLLPTNLPTLKLDEKRSDNIFMLEDETILILEYESIVDNKNLLKYAHYAFRVCESYYKEKLHKVIIAVIYTGDVQNAPSILDIGSIYLSFKQVFLSKINGEDMYEELKSKIQNDIEVTDEDIMKFIIIPLTRKTDKQELVENTVDLAKEIKDEEKRDFIIAGILSAADKFIDEEYSKKVKEWLKMTKVGKLFEEEKIEAVNAAIQKTAHQVAQEKDKKFIKNMLDKGYDIVEIMEVTGLTRAQIEELQKEV